MTKTFIFNLLMQVIIAILVINSLLALVAIHWTLFNNYSFLFTPLGINNYLTAFSQYKNLLAGTVAVVAAYFGFLRINAATVANELKFKNDRFSEWKSALDTLLIVVEKKDTDPFMIRQFKIKRYYLFEKLYDIDFNITNKVQLTKIYQAVFKDIALHFEQQNNEYIKMGGAYRDKTHSYSFDSLRFLFEGCCKSFYPVMRNDLKNLYLADLPLHTDIDINLYPAAHDNYMRDPIKPKN